LASSRLVMFFGYYQFDLGGFIGMQHASLDLLPPYVWFRTQMDARPSRPRGRRRPPRENNVVDITFNWFPPHDLAVAITLPTATAAYAARRAYSERHGRWMEQYAVQCPASARPSCSTPCAHDRSASPRATPILRRPRPTANCCSDSSRGRDSPAT
jgi:hypothetical protein